MEWRERLHRHGWPQVRTADTDVHDIGKGFVHGAPYLSAANSVSKGRHAGTDRKNIIHDVLTFNDNTRTIAFAQCHVLNCPPFGKVYLFTCKQSISLRWQLGGICEL